MIQSPWNSPVTGWQSDTFDARGCIYIYVRVHDVCTHTYIHTYVCMCVCIHVYVQREHYAFRARKIHRRRVGRLPAEFIYSIIEDAIARHCRRILPAGAASSTEMDAGSRGRKYRMNVTQASRARAIMREKMANNVRPLSNFERVIPPRALFKLK